MTPRTLTIESVRLAANCSHIIKPLKFGPASYVANEPKVEWPAFGEVMCKTADFDLGTTAESSRQDRKVAFSKTAPLHWP